MSLDETGYTFLRMLVRNRAGMVLDESKNYLIDSRLEPLARQENLAGLPELVHALRASPNGPLVEKVVAAMMVHETSFFRDLHPFQTLRDQLIPDLIKARHAERRLSIWCAAGSSGQEPYSIAMTLAHHFRELDSWDVTIHVSDISERMLQRTREGRYGRIEVNRGLPAQMLAKFFESEDQDWVVCERLRKMIRTFRINLIEPWPPIPQMDIIFIRNVLIYFEVEEKRSILERLALILRPDGALFLGAAETTLQLADQFESQRSGTGLFYRLCG